MITLIISWFNYVGISNSLQVKVVLFKIHQDSKQLFPSFSEIYKKKCRGQWRGKVWIDEDIQNIYIFFKSWLVHVTLVNICLPSGCIHKNTLNVSY